MNKTMKAAQISKYSKQIEAQVNTISIPDIEDHEVLVKVKAAAVNPLEMLIITGSVKLIQDYPFPLTIGNELAGVIEKVGKNVHEFQVGDDIYTRLPLKKIGAFAEYVAVDAAAIAPMPKNLSYAEGSAVALTGLTAYQGLHEELEAKSGQSVFIPGGSGSFGQIAVSIAKAMGLKVIVSGNAQTRERTLQIGADQYLDYTKENYVDVLTNIDHVIDALGPEEFDNELQIMKRGGRLLSLRTGPNKRFAEDRGFPWWKQKLFGAVGARYDNKAKKKDIQYRFIFVRSDSTQLKEITQIVETNHIVPLLHPQTFTINDINYALELVANGRPKGKVIIQF
ncbi:NADP-dependent oxidoreductase [Paenibacillus sp. PK4536]|uniref:NADP-dependent oxidoreductase n=1 Tax=Paenibacillus sp. PK4536 TaxID=3024576 RepID=UPI002359C25F|nr:NADP-dependent oxidoreductase [Paenibacillus sp. PK4536]WIM38682.1 NADP-dependent oxidoreductase [Paenibacillus sp. PK4536]